MFFEKKSNFIDCNYEIKINDYYFLVDYYQKNINFLNNNG